MEQSSRRNECKTKHKSLTNRLAKGNWQQLAEQTASGLEVTADLQTEQHEVPASVDSSESDYQNTRLHQQKIRLHLQTNHKNSIIAQTTVTILIKKLQQL